jgi:hypothetical protein
MSRRFIYRYNPPSFSTSLWSGLISYWKFDETGTTYYDSVGSVNLTATNMNSVTGKNLKGIMTTATSSRAAAGTSTDLNFERTDSWTFSFWSKGPKSVLPLSKMDIANNFRGYALEWGSDDTLYISLRSNNGAGNVLVGTTTTGLGAGTTSTWAHIVWTYDGSSTIAGMKIYINGVRKTVNTSTQNLTATIQCAKNFNVANRGVENVSVANYYTDEMACWNRVLTAEEVSYLYNGGSGYFY